MNIMGVIILIECIIVIIDYIMTLGLGITEIMGTGAAVTTGTVSVVRLVEGVRTVTAVDNIIPEVLETGRTS